MAYVTGWRVEAEILTRRWEDIDFDAGEVRLWVGEGKDRTIGRVFPMVTQLREALMDQRAYVTEVEQATGKQIPWVFVRADGQRVKSCRKAFKSGFRAIGKPGLPHDFRRSAVRNLERSKTPRSIAKAMVGHKTDSIYNRYAIVDSGMLEFGRQQLEAFFKKQNEDR